MVYQSGTVTNRLRHGFSSR